MMVEYANTYPGYGGSIRGYPTPDHRRAINDLRLTPLHRRSFGLVREIEARKAQPELVFEEIGPGESFCATPTSDKVQRPIGDLTSCG